MKAVRNQPNFVFVDCVIGIFFDLENPFATNWFVVC